MAAVDTSRFENSSASNTHSYRVTVAGAVHDISDLFVSPDMLSHHLIDSVSYYFYPTELLKEGRFTPYADRHAGTQRSM